MNIADFWHIDLQPISSCYVLVLWDQKIRKVLKTSSFHVSCMANASYFCYLKASDVLGYCCWREMFLWPWWCYISGVCFYFFRNRCFQRVQPSRKLGNNFNKKYVVSSHLFYSSYVILILWTLVFWADYVFVTIFFSRSWMLLLVNLYSFSVCWDNEFLCMRQNC